MIEFWRAAIRRQFHAAIDMLGNAIEACPESVWPGQGRGAFWYLAFHVLFFLDLYLSSEDESRFRPPAPFGLSELADEVFVPGPVYVNDELRGYLDRCRGQLAVVRAVVHGAWLRARYLLHTR